MFVAGLDENGLGPLLGPLTVTCATLEVGSYDCARFRRLGAALGIEDSKEVSAFGKMAHAESIALALCELQAGHVPRHVEELLSHLGLDSAELRGRCPDRSQQQCWSEPLPLPCFGGDLEAGRVLLAKLRARGVRVVSLQTSVACTQRLNDELDRGTSRVELDLKLMEELVLRTRAALQEDIWAICGMVGGIRDYPSKLQRISVTALPKRSRVALAYAATGVGTVSFEIDADARHLPVALASMVGKYVREVWMERQNRFYRAFDGELPLASGYHDPVTKRFIAASRLLRRKLEIADDCFERRSLRSLSERPEQESLFTA